MFSDLDILKKILLSGNCFQGASMMLHKDIINDYLPVPDEIKYHDSWLAALACYMNSFTTIDTVITKYRQHDLQVTSYDKINDDFNQGRILFCEELCKRNSAASSLIKHEIKNIQIYFSNLINNKKQSGFWMKNYKYIYADKNYIKFLQRLIEYCFK